MQRGFTLYELLVTMAVAGIVASLALPGLAVFVRGNRVVTQVNDLVGALNLARSEAVTRAGSVTVCAVDPVDVSRCASGSGSFAWDRGWLVFVDAAGLAGSFDTGDTLLRGYSVLSGGNRLSAATPFVRYRPDGFLESGATTFQLRVPSCSLDQNRNISVSTLGRPSVAHVAC